MSRPFSEKLGGAMSKPLAMWVRTLIALILSPVVFAVSARQIERDGFFTAIWDRSYEAGFWDAFWGYGGSGDVIWSVPSASAGLVAVIALGFVAIRGLLHYPHALNMNFLLFLIMDYFLFCGLVDIFIYGGTVGETFYYAGAFLGGIVFFGIRLFSQLGLMLFAVLVLIRLLYIEDIYPYMLRPA